MEARRPSNQAVDARTADAKLKSAKPRRVRFRSLAARAVCGLLTVAALLTMPVQVQAQTTVWSGTLTVRTLTTDTFGCNNFIGNNPCSTYLSDTDFTYNRITYSFRYIAIYPPNFLRITVDSDLATATQT